jgi:hypothetical protein
MEADIETLRETKALLDSIAEGRESLEELPADDELKETASMMDRISDGYQAWLELPTDDELQKTIELLERLVDLQKTIDPIKERVVALQAMKK